MSSSKKQERKERKRKKLLAEYELAHSNDAMKRPGELLDSDPVEVKKERKDEPKKAVTEELSSANNRLSDEEFKKLKKQLAERKRFLSQLPRFGLQYGGITASFQTNYNERVPLLMSDVQHLLVYALCGNSFTTPPNRWCSVEKVTRLTNMVALVVEGITSNDFLDHEHFFESLTAEFPDRLEVHAPVHYGSTAAAEFSAFPVTHAQKEHILNKYGSMKAAVASKEIMRSFRAMFPISTTVSLKVLDMELPMAENLPQSDIFPRTYLLLSTHQMMMENFPLPFGPFDVDQKYRGYEMTKLEYKEATLSSPMFAIDCEMCLTDQQKLELTHIAVVNENLEVVYETYVKPRNKIINYLTKFSGITEAILQNVEKRIEEVQADLRELLPEDAILIGHSLNSDLHALNLTHPYIIDTSVIYNLTGNRSRKSKLATLTEYFLGETIQACSKGHSPSEDAIASMKLVQLKLSKGFNFGDSITSEDGDASIPQCQLTTSIFNNTCKASKTVAVIGRKKDLDHYSRFKLLDGVDTSSYTTLPVTSAKAAIAQLENAAVNYNLALAHIDLTKKLSKCSTSEAVEKVLKKLDSWVNRAFSHVSLNGLCLIVFAGRTAKSKSFSVNGKEPGVESKESVRVESKESMEVESKESMEVETKESMEVETKESKSTESSSTSSTEDNRRHSGAAFIRIKSAKQK